MSSVHWYDVLRPPASAQADDGRLESSHFIGREGCEHGSSLRRKVQPEVCGIDSDGLSLTRLSSWPIHLPVTPGFGRMAHKLEHRIHCVPGALILDDTVW